MAQMATTIVSTTRRKADSEQQQEEPLIDLTAALDLHSKRLERKQKKLRKKISKKLSGGITTLLDLPYEILMHMLSYCLPSSVFNLFRVSRGLHDFIGQNQNSIGNSIISLRYPISERCLRVPVLLERVDPAVHSPLQSMDREQIRSILKRSFQHIPPQDPHVVCTCMTCILGWNSLSVAVDFARWQDNLDKGEPIPMIARGKNPRWNQDMLSENGLIVSRATRSPLWYARILQAHLGSTVRSIRRHGNNKGNKRARFRLTAGDVLEETDAFLGRSGPPTVDTPFTRDNYYMLESYYPNRSWNAAEGRWMYMPASQHETDLEIVKKWDVWFRCQKPVVEHGQ